MPAIVPLFDAQSAVRMLSTCALPINSPAKRLLPGARNVTSGASGKGIGARARDVAIAL